MEMEGDEPVGDIAGSSRSCVAAFKELLQHQLAESVTAEALPRISSRSLIDAN